MMTSSPPLTGLENPFPGLRPFRRGEEHLFFGRESQVDRMVDKLCATRFLTVVGTSGTGKSSLVNCGLEPALHRGVMSKAGTSWRIVRFRPGGSPIRSMARAFAAENGLFGAFEPESLSLLEIVEATLRMSSMGLADLFQYAQLAEGVNLLVVVDQFEELFRYGKAVPRDSYGVSGEATAFVSLLLEAHAQTTYPIYIALTMRSDFLGECSQFDGLPEVINEGQYLVPRMMREERRQAIAGPIAVSGGEISPVLLTRLVNDVGENPDQLSILQHAINRTWAFWRNEGGGEGALSLEHYENEKVGTMARALDLHAEEAYAELTKPGQQKICERVFKALTDTGTDARGIRRPMPFKDLCDIARASPEEVLPVLDVFRLPSRSFLMPPIAETIEQETVIDISHEILMRVWARLRAWADEEANSAATYRRIAETAELHAFGGAALWRDPDLQSAIDWQSREAPNPAWARLYREGFGTALNFIAQSKRVLDKEKAEAEFERRWRRITTYIAAVIFAVFAPISVKIAEYCAPSVHHLTRAAFKKSEAPPEIRDQLNHIPGVAPAIKQASSDARDTPEGLYLLPGLILSSVIGIVAYVGSTFVGKRVYRRYAFPKIIERTTMELPAPKKIRVEVDTAAVSSRKGNKNKITLADVPGAESLAGLSRMLAAVSIDTLALALLGAAFFVLFAAMTGVLIGIFDVKSDKPYDYLVAFLFFIWLPLLAVMFPALMTVSKAGGSLGDLVCGIAVIDLGGNRPAFGRVLVRYVASVLSWLLLGLGFLMQPFTPKKQTLHDLIAGTLVVRRMRRGRS